MEKELKQKLKDAKKALIEAMSGNDKAAELVENFESLRKQADIEPVELIVPTKEVVGVIDFDSFTLQKTIRGYLFTLKGGMQTFVDMRLTAVYEMLDALYRGKKGDTIISDGDKQADESLYSAIGYVMQAPLFASLSPVVLFTIAAHILESFNSFAEEHLNDAELHPETEADIKANIEAEEANAALSVIANTEVPDISED